LLFAVNDAHFEQMTCPIGRTLAVIGDRWSPLILRDVYLGISRFDAMARDLGISRKVLAERLADLVEHGVLTRVAYQENPPRYDYRPTEKGAELAMVLLAMKAWGDKWTFPEGRQPMLLRHETCGATAQPAMVCSECGEPLEPRHVTFVEGPGEVGGPGAMEVPAAMAALREARAAG
jgi:DNA-binding HxlR family transcriptional regulator